MRPSSLIRLPEPRTRICLRPLFEVSARASAERKRLRVAEAHGWNKAVAILEKSAAEEDQEAAEAKRTTGKAGAVIDEPGEQIDFAIGGGAA